jgi:uncharacterized protein (TIGR03790 family)
MRDAGRLRLLPILLIVLLLTALLPAVAGGGPQNVLVVVNANSRESLEIGNLYRRARGIPYRHVVTLSAPTVSPISWQTYCDEIETPIHTYLRNQQLAEQITCIVLTRGVPRQVAVENGRATASLLAAMVLRGEDAAVPTRKPNPYLDNAVAFTPRQLSLRGIYLVTTLDGFDNGDIAQLIERGSAADSTAAAGLFAFQTSAQLSLEKLGNAADLLVQQGYQAEVLNAPPAADAPLAGYLSGGIYSGLSQETILAGTYVPGALVDMAQPYGAAPNNFDESIPPTFLPISWFVRAGATGVHGTVGDPGLNSLPAVARPQTLLDRYTRGFSLAEAYYAAMPYLAWQNVVIGDPLAAPYARRPVVAVESDLSTVTGLMPVRVSATAASRSASVSRIDLYIDDRFAETLYDPAGNIIRLRVGECVVDYTIPAGATLRAVLDGLAEAVNASPDLQGPRGVRAAPVYRTSSVQVTARTPGQEGNALPILVEVEGVADKETAVVARTLGGLLQGGGQAPTPARATLSFLGRVIKPGDEVEVHIQRNRIVYRVPPEQPGIAALLDGLVQAINASPILQQPYGVVAYRDPQGMPFIVLEARSPGEQGNQIPVEISVRPTEGSQLRAYPEMPTYLAGGHDGSAASQTVLVQLGAATARGIYLLDSTALADGRHTLRAVAYDNSPAQVQSWLVAPFTVTNLAEPPVVHLPSALPPCTGEVEVPMTAAASVTRVDLFVDGQLLGSDTEAPFSMRLPLAGLGHGVHDLHAEGFDAQGHSYVTATVPLQVLVPPEVTRINPDHTIQAGGTTHRISGSGFLPGCTVRLAGVPARQVTCVSPNLLHVVSDAGPIRRGWVEVANPDGLVGTLASGFEYYVPRVADVQITPDRDVLAPGRTALFTAQCFDQFGHPLAAKITWSASGGVITPHGEFTAMPLGQYRIRAHHPDRERPWETIVTVGNEPLGDGQLRQWLVLGPFADPDGTGLEASLLPESAMAPAHGEQQGDAVWKSVYAANDFVDLTSAFSPHIRTVAYAHLYLHAPREVEATLVFGSDDGIRLWWNGEMQYSLRTRRAADPNQGRVAVTLRQGWNRLLVKVDQAEGRWGFFMRLVPAAGSSLVGVTYALDRP